MTPNMDEDRAVALNIPPLHLVAGRAMAATLLDTPAGTVTDAEAKRAFENYTVRGDTERTARVIRAGVHAVVLHLEEGGLFPTALAGELVGTFQALDRGEVRGAAVPTRTGRHEGAFHRDELSMFVAAETAFRMGFSNCSRDDAVGTITGVTRNDKAVEGEPVIPFPSGITWSRVRDLLLEGIAILGKEDGFANARDQGTAARLGLPVDPEFGIYRAKHLALFANTEGRDALFAKAGLKSPQRCTGKRTPSPRDLRRGSA